MRDQIGIEPELSERRRKVEGGVGVVPREEFLRSDVRHRDGVHVITLAEDERHCRKDEGGEREAGCKGVARRRPQS